MSSHLQIKWLIIRESMAFHEGIPGHHLQLAISSELTGVPEFRKHLHNSAYAEGWGLYTERLADEMGLYSGPVDRIGMLAADSMRACRLVVDTGMHAMKWSRERAIDYMVSTEGIDLSEATSEIDRYAVWPGQALGYKLGMLKLQELRAEAERERGEGFDIREFHDQVLRVSSAALPVIESEMRAWIDARR